MIKRFQIRNSRRFLFGLLALAGGAVPSAPAAGVVESAITEFSADRRAVASAYAVPWAEAAMDRDAALLTDWQGRVESLDYGALAPAERVDWHLLRSHLAGEQETLTLERGRLGGMEPLLAFRRPLQELLGRQELRQDIDPQVAAGVLAQALTEVKALRKRLEEGRAKDAPAEALKPGAVLASRTAGAMDQLRDAMGEWFKFYHGFQPDFSWWVRQPHEALAKGMEETATYLRKEVAALKGEPDDPLVGDPIGATALAACITREMIPYSAEELLAVAEREFAWCGGELQKAAAAMGCQDGKQALAKIKETHAAPGGQAATAVAAGLQAIRFVEERELVTIPALAGETWRLGMLGVDQQKSLPYAVYSDPRMLVAYAHESMSHEDKLMSMRGNNAAFLHIVTPHELIPGHHLQGFMARRYAPHRQLFRTPFFVEGWALHWEMLLWDLGYVASPEEKVGALFWRMHRCARIMVSLKFHLGAMTPAAMVDFLVDRVGHERSGATAEVRRYIGSSYGPLYQAAYMLGGLQLRALYQELTGPGKLTPRAFHDAVLQQNAIPLEMIRTIMIGAELPRDWKPSWRF
jgi:hypothetical protein